MSKNHIHRLTLTSVFIAIALVLSTMSRMIYFSGGAGMRIGFSSYISVLPAFLFGPLWGGLAMGIMDVLAFIIKPEGGYLLPLTVTAILGGILRGTLWKVLKGKKLPIIPCICVFLLILLVGAFNYFAMGFQNSYGEFLRSFNGKSSLLIHLPVIFSGLMIVFTLLNLALKKTKIYSDNFVPVLITLMLVNIAVTTVNTVILMIFIPSLSKLGFAVFYLPRLAEEIANTSIQAVVVSYLIKLSNKLIN